MNNKQEETNKEFVRAAQSLVKSMTDLGSKLSYVAGEDNDGNIVCLVVSTSDLAVISKIRDVLAVETENVATIIDTRILKEDLEENE